MDQQHNEAAAVWLEQPTPTGLGAELAKKWANKEFISIAGAYDPIGALLARQAGFDALYLSGGALTASLGLPDLGLITMDELVDRARAIVRAVRIPLVVDGDTVSSRTWVWLRYSLRIKSYQKNVVI